jgi:hypothetical protein
MYPPSNNSSRRRLLAALAVLPLVGLASSIWAAADSDPFNNAFALFQNARQGNSDRVEPAIAALQGLPRLAERQPLYAAYLGSALTLKGKAAWMPWNKMKYTDQGLDQIDQALAALKPEHDRIMVQDVPVSLNVRFVAAATFIAVPDGIFHRRANGKSQLAILRAHPLVATVPAAFRADIVALEAQLKEAEK